jgi:hypothetical protein
VQDVSDNFLLTLAEVSGGLLGLFVVGLLFFIETGFDRLGGHGREAVEGYFRASARIVLLLLVIPLTLSLTLVTLSPTWNVVLFGLLSVTLIGANLDTAARIREVRRVTGSQALLINEIAGSVAVAALIALPWVLGGIDPNREDLTASLLLSFGAAIASLFTLVLSTFDLAADRRQGLRASPSDRRR